MLLLFNNLTTSNVCLLQPFNIIRINFFAQKSVSNLAILSIYIYSVKGHFAGGPSEGTSHATNGGQD